MNADPAVELRVGVIADFERLMEHVARWRQLDLLDVEVTMSQARCLLLVALDPSMSISALATHLRIGLPAASGLVERLVERGYLVRRPDPADRRQQLVTLSEAGRRLVERLHELSSAKLGDLLRGLTVRELRALAVGVAALEREARVLAYPSLETPHPERTSA